MDKHPGGTRVSDRSFSTNFHRAEARSDARMLFGVILLITLGNSTLIFLLSGILSDNSSQQLEALVEEKEAEMVAQLRARVESTYSIISHFASTMPNRAQAKEMSIDVISSVRFGDNNYIWVHQPDPLKANSAFMLVHPADKLRGKDVSGLIDLDNVDEIYLDGEIFQKDDPAVSHIEPTDIFAAFNEVCLEDGEGIVTYYWPKIIDGQTSSEAYKKISFVKYMPEWNWILGAGAYADHIDAAVSTRTASIKKSNTLLLRKVVIISLLLSVAIIALVVIQIRRRQIVRRRANTSLMQIKAAVDASSNAIGIATASGRHFYQNKTFTQLFGYQIEEFETLDISAIYADQTTAKETFETLTSGGNCNKEIEMVAKDGRHFPVLLKADSVRNEAGQIIGLIGIHSDITDQKQAEQQINDYAEKLESNNRTLGELRKSAEAANRSKSEFLANMSHEIRTPMTAVLGYTDILLESLKDQKQLDAGMTIKRNGTYLLGLINDILDLSKIEAGKLEVENISCSPCQVLSEVASLMRVRANTKNLSLEIKYKGPIPQSIQSDPTRLRQILINLTGNAIKFTGNGTIRLVASLIDDKSPKPKMQFEVIDSGIGITEEQIANLFKPFQQADTTTTRKYGGTGLGLTISKRIADKLGGDITVRSTPGKGSNFTVTVGTGPLKDAKWLDNPTEAQVNIDTARRVCDPKTSLDCRVLLAEDGPDNQRLISFLLKKAGAEVAVAANGLIAKDIALAERSKGTPFDVILMDMQMPVMDGYTATRTLREAGYTGPIIAVTALAMSTDRKKCLAAGCDDYLTKPIDRKKLISTVARYATQNEPCKADSSLF